jgi:hypothetical protein
MQGMTMQTDLLAELTHEAADSSRRKARYVKVFAAALGERAAELDRRTVQLILREAVAQVARSGTDDVRRWGALVQSISTGTRSSVLKITVADAIEVFEAWMAWEGATRKCLAHAPEVGLTIEPEVISELDNTARTVAAAKAEAVAILAALDRPRPEIDAGRLADGRKDAAEGRTMKSDEVIAAIRAARK